MEAKQNQSSGCYVIEYLGRSFGGSSNARSLASENSRHKLPSCDSPIESLDDEDIVLSPSILWWSWKREEINGGRKQ